jgi:hypothetical protein
MITWSIDNMLRDSATGFVLSVEWRAVASAQDKKCETKDICNFTFNGKVPIRYEELTQEIVLGWVFESIDKASVEAGLVAKLDKMPASGYPWDEVIA